MKSDDTVRPSPLIVGGADDPFLAHIEPLLQGAQEVAIVAAFVRDSGLRLLGRLLRDAVRRGATVRILTSDYCNITEPAALSRLLNWMNESEAGVLRADENEAGGLLQARIVSIESIGRGFHPKSWRFTGPEIAVAFVGSSNLSAPALEQTIEWNLRVDRDRDPFAYQQIADAFEAVWPLGGRLTASWIAAYAERVRAIGVTVPPDAAPEKRSVQEPHELQRQALLALAAARAEGRTRALVVLATGLGKTLLAALDVEAFTSGYERPPRVLILAHRDELLAQAEGALLNVLAPRWPTLQATWYAGIAADLSGDIVLGSVSKLARAEHLERLAAQRFDYVIVDEAHHAAAASYRRILDRLQAGFLLGLTATPDRADQQSIAGLFDHFTAYNAGLAEGIRIQRLVPFAYHGIPDDVDYQLAQWAIFNP